MINPEDLEGITSGDCNVSENKIFADLKLLTNYSVNVKDEFEFSFSDNETGKTYSGIAEETENNSYIYEGTDKDGRAVEFYMPKPVQQSIVIASREKELDDENKIELFMGNDENRNSKLIKMYLEGKHYISKPISFVKGAKESYDSIMLKNKLVELLFTTIAGDPVAIQSYNMYVKYDNLLRKIGNGIRDAYMIKAWGPFGGFLEPGYSPSLYRFMNSVWNIINLGYSAKIDKSPTKREFENNLENLSILYTFSHGDVERVFEGLYPVDIGFLKLFKEPYFSNKFNISHEEFIKQNPNYVTYKSFINKKTDYKVVFFNGCKTGTEFFYEKFLEHIKTDVYIGWKEEVNPVDASNLAEKFFELCNKIDPKTNDFYLVDLALKNAYRECFDENINPFTKKIFIEKNKDISLKVK